MSIEKKNLVVFWGIDLLGMEILPRLYIGIIFIHHEIKDPYEPTRIQWKASFPGNVSIWRPFLFTMWTRNRNQEDNSNHY